MGLVAGAHEGVLLQIPRSVGFRKSMQQHHGLSGAPHHVVQPDAVGVGVAMSGRGLHGGAEYSAL